MSTDTAFDPLADVRRRSWRRTVRQRFAEAPLLIPVAAAAGHAWGGWWWAAAGGGMLVLIVVSAVTTHAWLMGAYAGDPLRPPARWSAVSVWVGSCPAWAGLAACGYLALGSVGALVLGVAAAVLFGLTAALDLRVVRDARATVGRPGGSPPPPAGASARPETSPSGHTD